MNILIYGSGGHAGVVADVAMKAGYNPIGFLDVRKQSQKNFINIPSFEKIEDVNSNFEGFIVGIGDNQIRKKVFKETSGKPLLIIHPSAIISESAIIGEGSFVGPGVVINAGAKIGKNCILNTACVVEHDCLIGDHSFIGPGAILGGDVEIGNTSQVSLGAKILQGLSVGENTIIGAGSLVTRSVGPNVVSFGSPAQIVRERTSGDRFFFSK